MLIKVKFKRREKKKWLCHNFSFHQQNETVVDENGEPWFCAKDVFDALKHTNSRRAIAQLVDEGDVTKRYTPTSSGDQLMTYINESGLYSLILSSKLESAKRFKHRVTSDVLPAIPIATRGLGKGEGLGVSG